MGHGPRTAGFQSALPVVSTAALQISAMPTGLFSRGQLSASLFAFSRFHPLPVKGAETGFGIMYRTEQDF